MFLKLFVLAALAAAVACILSPTARRVIGWTGAVLAGLLVLATGAMIYTMGDYLHQNRLARERIAKHEVRLDQLQLTGGSPKTYRLSGLLTNLSPRYMLSSVSFGLVVEDCIATQCREQARGHAEVIRTVRPNETIGFSIDYIHLPSIAPPVGKRRLSYHVSNTYAFRIPSERRAENAPRHGRFLIFSWQWILVVLIGVITYVVFRD